MSERIDFDGRVIIVTGAGRGMGAAHAKELAARGARVVVNDLGGSIFGDGSDAGPAAEVVAEIVADGGVATADTSDIGSPEGCAELIGRAVETYGGVDGILHNAGINDVAPLEAMSEEAFERVLRVHLYGAFNLTSQAWPYLARSKGRVVYISSAIGFFGGPNLGSYATAKTALIGLARVAAIEGRASGVAVNVLGVFAATRMSLAMAEGLPDLQEWFNRHMSPTIPAAAATWLLHPDSTATGRVFEAFGPHMSEVLMAETRGVEMFDASPEEYRDRFEEVVDRDELIFPAGFEDFHERMFNFLEAGGAEPLSAAARGRLIPPVEG